MPVAHRMHSRDEHGRSRANDCSRKSCGGNPISRTRTPPQSFSRALRDFDGQGSESPFLVNWSSWSCFHRLGLITAGNLGDQTSWPISPTARQNPRFALLYYYTCAFAAVHGAGFEPDDLSGATIW